MVRQDGAAGAQAAGCARCGARGGDAANPELLVAALEQALLAAQHLLGALGAAADRHADAPAHQDRAPNAPHSATGRPCGGWTALDEAHVTLVSWPTRACPGAPEAPAAPGGLSQREAEVLRLLAAGHGTRQIAQALFLSPRTVQRHVANAYLKIGAHRRAEAIAYAIDHGLR